MYRHTSWFYGLVGLGSAILGGAKSNGSAGVLGVLLLAIAVAPSLARPNHATGVEPPRFMRALGDRQSGSQSEAAQKKRKMNRTERCDGLTELEFETLQGLQAVIRFDVRQASRFAGGVLHNRWAKTARVLASL
eukprot:CAMPEP_0117661338 /NCGR_PEP_ID=MMETSP0804-20121206/7484_1 /TAXON_ID=1074897 /ORGANISM="Tetraselmis astigmatica, Strain CCMP880" /LENGTH=133 /DNA_ID=CAMNT_0005468199 /DNA_START=40 /DNA_END=440 /DNA_ORIENTATION=+